ncbi:MAG: flagellar protein FlaB, partial [Desulfobacterales bacterium]|nr:flagellar protein FlaB [Desulfobacterales bacterium]
MGLNINTNVSALNAHKNMVKNDNALSSSLERLSSGLRINKAADDASGMSIADSLKSQAMGLGQAIRNANDGINIVQTADAALEESINIVTTIKTKAIQAAQDGQTTESRQTIQADITKLMEELDMIAQTTSFNGQKLLFGNFSNKSFQVGAYSGETVNISIDSAQSTKLGHVTSSDLTLTGNAPGTVELSIYSNLQNKSFIVESVEVAYDNNSEHSMGALADSINKLSDVLGITATASVQSTTQLNIAAGTTNSDFAINGVTIGQVNVLTNDADGALAKAINSKTSQHGVVASVDNAGYLTLNSTDQRAIQVTSNVGSGTGTDAVLRGSDLSTLGSIQLNQTGSSEIIVNDVGGGNAIALTTNLEVEGNTTTTLDSTLATGSQLAAGSQLEAGWTTGQTLSGSWLLGNFVTTEDSTLSAGSVLGNGSLIKSGSVLGGDAEIAAVAATAGNFELATDSTLLSGSILASGTVFGGTVATSGNTAITTNGTATLTA